MSAREFFLLEVHFFALGVISNYALSRPPAPEPGANRVMTGQSPILAQTFTEPFIVYSAKRFPGVPGVFVH